MNNESPLSRAPAPPPIPEGGVTGPGEGAKALRLVRMGFCFVGGGDGAAILLLKMLGLEGEPVKGMEEMVKLIIR